MTSKVSAQLVVEQDDPLGDVVYCETFPNPGIRGAPLSQVGWAYYLGVRGHEQSGNEATQSLLCEQPGGSPDTTSVAAGGEAQTPDQPVPTGLIVNALGPDGEGEGLDPWWNQLTLYATREVSVDLSQIELTQMSFELALSQPDEVRLVCRVDGQWWVSQETFTAEPVDGREVFNFAKVHVTRTLDPRGTVWLPLNFTPGVALGFDPEAKPQALPQAQMDGIGLFLDPTGFEAFDTVTVRGIVRSSDVP